MKGRPRKINSFAAALLRLYYKTRLWNVESLALRFGVSKRTIYRYIAKGGYNGNVKKRLHKGS